MSVEQRDQSSTDIVIVAIAAAAVFFVLQIQPVQLAILGGRAALDARVAAVVGEQETAKSLGELSGWCYRMAFDEKTKKKYRLDLEEAKTYYAAVASDIATQKQIGALAGSLLFFGLIVRGVVSDIRKNRIKETYKPNPKLSPIANAKNMIIAKTRKEFHARTLKAKTATELFSTYVEIRNEVNIPNNLVARCWPYGSPERKMFLDACRGLSLAEERK
jgi:hypothetical protein